MIRSYEEDEFIAVRVQDPRVQNQGSWNSYVDFKIFLHTNSKAFTAKTSCVRRRFSEFVWLKKKMQKNCGLVQVPDLPSKSYFSFINEDFLEKRRKGLQFFLDKVLHMTVCLSDSQLHLFLQTQLPIGHIQDCVQGHTPYTVTDAILTYASSNQGWAQEEDVIPERTPTPVPYESMESPAPHQPTMPSAVLPNPALLTPSDPVSVHTEESVSHIHDSGELQCTSPSLLPLQEDSRLEIHGPAETTSDGDLQVDWQRETSVEVHCLEGAEEECLVIVEKVLEREHSEERIPPTSSTCEPVGHELEGPQEPLEMAVREQDSHATLTHADDTLQETGLKEDANEPMQQDAAKEHLHATETRREEDHRVEAAYEAQNDQQATQEKNTVEVDDDDDDDDNEADSNEEQDLYQEMDLDRQSRRETSSEESSVGDVLIEDAHQAELSHVTNGFQESQQEDERCSTDSTDSTDVPLSNTKATDDTSRQDGMHEAASVQEEIDPVKANEEDEICYMTSSYSAPTLERLPSGLVDVVGETHTLESQENNHLEASDDGSTEEVILLTTEPDSEVTLKSQEREVYEPAADANLTGNQDKELELSLHTQSD